MKNVCRSKAMHAMPSGGDGSRVLGALLDPSAPANTAHPALQSFLPASYQLPAAPST